MNNRLKVMKVTPQLQSRARNSNRLTGECRECGKSFEVNESIITKKTSRKSNTYVFWYHMNCARSLNIID